MNDFATILDNQILMGAVIAWLIAQTLKVLINLALHRTIDLGFLFSSGGFPSSHSATVSALAIGVGKTVGWDSSLFAIAVVLAMIVMYDAAGVRRAAGKQAEIINQLVEGLYHQLTHLSQERLKELIGHSPIEVGAGMVLGIIVGLLV